MDLISINLFLQWILGAAIDAANTAWMQALVASAVGAWAGSWATQKTINRHEELNDARSELRAVNHAINLCFTVTNHHLGYKKQMTLPMLLKYKALDTKVRKSMAANDKEVSLELDFLILPTFDLPISQLQSIILEKLPIGGRGLVAAMQLCGANQSLIDSLQERRSLIGEVKTSGISGNKLSEFYLGLPDAGGNVDHRFHDNVLAIAQLSDDCIFFSTIVAKDLHRHGERLLAKYGRRLGTKRRNLARWNWDATSDTLMPKDEHYESWLKGFPEPVVWWKFWSNSKNGV